MSTETSKTENYLREFLYIFFAQRSLILWVALTVFLAAVFVALLWPRTWAANGSFIVKGVTDKSIATLEDSKQLLERTRKEDLFSEAAIFTSNDVIAITLAELEKSPEQKIRNLTALAIKGNISTKVLPSSNVIEVQFNWRDAQEAKWILESLMGNYLLFRNSLYNPPQRQQVFETRGKNYMSHLEDEQQRLLEAIEANKAPNPELEITHNLEIRQANLKRIQSFEEQLTDTFFLIKQIGNDLEAEGIHFFSYVDVDSITVLNSKLQELVIKRNNILTVYRPTSEKAIAISKEVERTATLLKSELASYKQQLEDQVKALKEKIRLLEESNQKIDTRNLVLKELDIRLDNIGQESQLLSLSYDTFFKRREEANFINTSSSVTSYVSIIAGSRALEHPVFPRAGIILPSGLLGGLLLGFALGFLREFLEHDFKRPEDVERYLGLPVIASLSEQNTDEHPRESPLARFITRLRNRMASGP
jgi:succinoglycan biosynthesis transport protein ExoP